MVNFLLNLVSLLSGRRLPNAENWAQTNQQLANLSAKNASLEHYVEQLKHQYRNERQLLSEQHTQAIQALQKKVLDLSDRLNTQKSLADQLALGADLQAQRHLAENQALLNQLNWLSGTIAHDFRAPLRAIDANCFFLEDDLSEQAPPESLKTLHEISRNGKRMGVLIDGLLDYLRVGIVPLKLSTLSLRELLDTVIESEFSLLQHPIKIIDTQHHLMQGRKLDRNLIQRLFKEVLDNAVKFSQNALPQPKIVVRAVSENQIDISDNGVGFNTAHVAQLFQLFHRLHGNDEFPGEGIGLCIAQRIAMRHHAELHLIRQDEVTLVRLTFKTDVL